MKKAGRSIVNEGHLSHNLLEEMNAVQVRENINKKTIAVLIFGACENHGNHMPFGSDFIFPEELAKRTVVKARKKSIVILPPIPYGASLHHNEFQMTMSLEPHTVEMVIEDLFSSIIKNGISRILVINGHDGNISPIENAARKTKDRHKEVVIACLEAWWVSIGEITSGLFEVWQGLDLVDMNFAPEEVIPRLPSEKVRIYWKFDELTDTGATGAPRKASVQKGEEALKALEATLLSFLNEMDETNWGYGLSLK